MEVADEFSDLGGERAAQLLHDYTFGIKRCLRSLLSLSYLQMRSSTEKKVLVSHVTAAYHSLEYAAMREDVENLAQGRVSPKLVRKDLSCRLVESKTKPEIPPTSVGDRTQTRAIKNATNSALLSMLTPEMRALLSKLENQASPSANVVPKAPRKPAPSVENLLGGAARFFIRDKTDR